MLVLCANIEFVFLTDFELSVVAKPINSTSVQKVVKNFKNYLAKPVITPLVIVNFVIAS